MTMAVSPECAEVTRLETDRTAIFEGLRNGFARAYDCLVEDPKQRGKGMEMAKQFFPDEILDYDPTVVDDYDGDASAFQVYMRDSQVLPKAWTKAERASAPVP